MKKIPFAVINQIKSDIIRCDNQNEINGSEKLYNELVAKYSRIFSDFSDSIVKSGKVAALGNEFDYRPELKQISAILNMELLLSEIDDTQSPVKENVITESSNPQLVQNYNFYGGHPNVNTGNGEMNVNQNICDTQKLERAIAELKECANTMSAEIRDTVEECIEVIETLKTDRPKRGLLKTALATLNGINGTVQFGAAVLTISDIITKYIA